MLSFGRTSMARKLLETGSKMSDYKIEEIIGEGTYGKVKLATHLATNEKVAIKIIDKSKLINEGDNDRILNEMKILIKLDHPNILKAFEVFEEEKYYYIVMERPAKGDLFNYICTKGRLSMDEASFIYYQIVNAIQYLHKNKIVHRDINFKRSDIKLQTNCGSPCYSAPEVLRGNKYKPTPIDIWGIGIILYCMVCGELPFEDEREDILIRKVTLCNYNCPLFVSPIFKSLFRRILCPNPNERLTIDKIKMNCVYNMGKANFYKYFKIYGENGELLPQVKKFIKAKALKSLEVAYAMEISKDSENLPGYKIYFNKYMHDIDWSSYYIPKSGNESAKYINGDQITKFRKKKKYRNQSYDKGNYYKNNNKNDENDKNNDVLFIPQHESINDAIFYEEKKCEKINVPTRNIDGIRKLGVFSHSFDDNAEYVKEANNRLNIQDMQY